MSRIITISREFGSGGRLIGKMAAERLGIPCYDEELIPRIAKKTGISEEDVRERGEYAHGIRWNQGILTTVDFRGRSAMDALWKAQSGLILEIARQGQDCVIIGRCADYLLRERADLLRVFIHAPMEFRIRQITEFYHIRDAAPERLLKDRDKRRSSYYKYYTDLKWGEMSNYDLVLNSATLGLERCADAVAGLF